ncbi:MAG: cellulase family glycosylhydrolase [Chloroflexi bacterium]|nr:cellulase family glycosylhydrolase [Chloroflexota bacterium]
MATTTDWKSIRGFNYQPSYASGGLEIWLRFDAACVARELERGVRYFPNMNAIRLWLAWDAWQRHPRRFGEYFEEALRIADSFKLRVMPVLFNRWHDHTQDYGGIYIDHFYPRASWVQSADTFGAYLTDVVGTHADDPRVIAWDLCNEPFSYGAPQAELGEIARAEFAWLEGTAKRCRELGAEAPITIGIHPGHGRAGLEQVEPLCDVLSIHPYWTRHSPEHPKEGYEALLDDYVDVAAKAGKPLVATETTWGSQDDDVRVEIIRYTLTQLKAREIGWFAYILHHSLIPDAHRSAYGPLSAPGNLAYIEADGALRRGHGVYNEF